MYTLHKDTRITSEIIFDVIRYNDGHKARFDRLENYYMGVQDILGREKLDIDGSSNNKVVINHAKYITDTNTGYLLGNPIDYQVNDLAIDVQPILDAYKKQTINDLDTEIAKDLSIFGLQHEYVYANEEGDVKSANLDNRNAIIVYDTTIEHNKLFSVRYRPIYEGSRKTPTHYEVSVADKTDVTEYQLQTRGVKSLVEISSDTHGFGDVPMIEYRNNSDLFGDFEPVITLMDAYNLVQSDRVNEKEQLVDAILAFYGADVKKLDMDALRQNRVISGIPADAKVEYITKNSNEADADTLRKNLEADIHKISMTPNMSDAEFVGNSSGVAIRYKLLSFEQNIKNKERNMERGLMERFELYWTHLLNNSKTSTKVQIAEIDAVFTRNLPSNDLETSSIIANLKGVVDDETLIGQLSFIKDASEVILKAKKEAEERQSKLADAFTANTIADANTDDTNTPVEE